MKQKIIIISVLVLGIACLLFPVVGNIFVVVNQNSVIDNYNKEVARVENSKKQQLLKDAEKYNAELKKGTPNDPFESTGNEPTNENTGYYNALNIGQDAMGYISIPKIAVDLPIYHGTSEKVLSAGVGHILGTALPIGGVGTHSVLTGHTGIPGSMLFTDLNKLDLNDIFYIKILDETLAYKVDQIKVVEPWDTAELTAIPQKDYITLITCTPYGINSHRLLVRGERTELSQISNNDGGTLNSETIKSNETLANKSFSVFGTLVPFWVLYIIIPVLLLIVAVIVIIAVIKKKNKKKHKNTQSNQ